MINMAKAQGRGRYERPIIRELGTLSELTLGGGAPVIVDLVLSSAV